MELSIILFAIRATLKMGTATRKAYVDSTRNQAIILPPLGVETDVSPHSARAFFYDNERFLNKKSGYTHPRAIRIKNLMAKLEAGPVTPKEAAELVRYCKDCKEVVDLEHGSGQWGESEALTKKEVQGLLALGTWTWGEGGQPQWWMTIGEALFDVGLEFALNDPKICNPDTSTGQALGAFLLGIQKADLQDVESKYIPVFLLTTAMDVLSTCPEIASGGKRGQALVSATASKLSEDIAARLKDPDNDVDTVKEWGGLVFRSLLTSGGRLAISQPGAYLGVQGDGSEAMASAVGGALMDVVLKGEGAPSLRSIFDLPALEKIADAALLVVAQHPGMVTSSQNEGIRSLITAMATDLAAIESIFTNAAVPDIMRLILENTAGNMELIWPDITDPKKNLLFKVARKTLQTVSAKPSQGQKWTLAFTPEDTSAVVEVLFTELKANPAWLVRGDDVVNELLPIVLDQVLAVIRSTEKAEMTRLAARTVLAAAMKAGMSRAEFLENTKYEEVTRPFLVWCIDLVLATAFGDLDWNVSCRLSRDEGLNALIAAVLKAAQEAPLGDAQLRAAALGKLKQALDSLSASVRGGEGIDFAAVEKCLEEGG